MKKLLSKVKRKHEPSGSPGRITNETIAEHRERILAEGRKFKYPMQYTKHRVLLFTLAVVICAVIGFGSYVGLQLYSFQSYDAFMLRVTQVVPLPVASIDGEWVRYSDYLNNLHSSVHYLTTKEAVNFKSESEKQQLNYQKRLALDKAIRNTLVKKIARDNSISVSSQEVDDFIDKQISASTLGVSKDVYKQIIRDYYDWSFDEYRTNVGQQLLQKKVNAQLDSDARSKAERLLEDIRAGKQFVDAIKELSKEDASKSQDNDAAGFVSAKSDDPDGLIEVASKLKQDEVSSIIEGTEGLYVIKLLEKRDNGDVRFAKLFVAYKMLINRLDELNTNGKIAEYIGVPALVNPTTRQ